MTAGDWLRCCNVLRQAIVEPGSAAARLTPLRPSLARAQADLVRMLDEAVSSQNGNASVLVLGPPGTGKTLVRRGRATAAQPACCLACLSILGCRPALRAPMRRGSPSSAAPSTQDTCCYL
jgi:hypothetical protein